MRKHAEAIGSGTADPVKSQGAITPVPMSVVENKPAPGRKGPTGLAPRTTYSQVNTGMPPAPQMGATGQKNVSPRGMEFLPAKVAEVHMATTHAQRPTLQDMLKEAMAGTLSRANTNAEAARQLGQPEEETPKTASANLSSCSTEYVTKLAGALAYISEQIKQADSGNVQKPGEGPNALPVMEATSSDKNIDAGELGSAIAQDTPPKDPPMQPEQVQTGKAGTGFQTNDDMKHPEQPTEPIPNQKASIGPAGGPASSPTVSTKTSSALALGNMMRLGLIEEGSAKLAAKNMARLGLVKSAEDAINPASVSAGKDDPPDASASEEGLPPRPSDVTSQEKMVGSNDAAINYTKGKAKADPVSDVRKVLDQPAMSKTHDPVLHKVLDNTGKAGVKLSSAKPTLDSSVKVAAARALLSNLVEKVAEGDCGPDGKKKEKKSMMGGAPSNPSSASGFTASSLG